MIDKKLRDSIYDLTYFNKNEMNYEIVGCFCCKKIFLSYQIKEFTQDNCAVCPYCSVDSVIPMVKSFNVLLEHFNEHQFGIQIIEEL